MKTLVIGGAGYIGSHMLRCLVDAHQDVVAFDNLSTGHRAAVGAAELIEGDLCDTDSLGRALARVRPDVVMHFAALSLVGESVRDPLRYYAQNVGGTIGLLETMRRHEVPRLVFSSTAAVFGTPLVQPIAEDAVCTPINPYGWSKLMAERTIADACAAHDLRAICLRYFNAAGAHRSGEIGESHQPETHLIPNLLRAAAGLGPPLTVFGTDHPTPDGSCLRDYVHVEDLAQAHALAARRLADADRPRFEAYNLGNGQGFSVLEVLRAAERVVGRPIAHHLAGRREGDPPCLVACSDRARSELGWSPQIPDIEPILSSAWRWHHAPRF